jgi:hypothetical protein
LRKIKHFEAQIGDMKTKTSLIWNAKLSNLRVVKKETMTINPWVASYMQQTNSVQCTALAVARGKTSEKNCNARAA